MTLARDRDPAVAPGPGLRRELSLLDATMINVGSMVGSGIFLVPAAVALYVHSSALIILVWSIGGVVSLCGALSVAELGAMYPKAGGQYVYLREAYGPLWGFLYGWTAFAVIMTATIAAVAVGFASYLGYLLPLSESGVKAVAIGSIVVLTALNCLGVKFGSYVQNILTVVKMAALGGLIAVSFALGHGGLEKIPAAGPGVPFTKLLSSLGLALVAVLWAYDGWVEITYVAGEVRDPERNIHRSVILSTLVVIAVYILCNVSYLAVLSPEAMSHSLLVASDAASAVMGPSGGVAAALAVSVAMLGCNNGFVLTGARIYYAMSSEGLFFRSFARVHPRFHTPVPSLIGQGVWSCALVLTGTFTQLFTYVMFASWIFYGMAAGAVILLRRRSPGMTRPYRAWGYPFVQVIFILFSCLLVLNTLIEDPRDSLIGIAIILLGLPAYLYWRRRLPGETGRGPC
jgi:APA family basic amino acid/polyamine antiporter